MNGSQYAETLVDYQHSTKSDDLEKHRKLPLLAALKHYSEQDIAAFDVPGHKRGRGVPILNEYFGTSLMKMDINSLPELDNVSNSTGVIKEARELLADAYNADTAFFMTNGTTSAIHCMLMTVLEPGDKVLLPRNIHKSVLNGLILCGAVPIYVETDILIKEEVSGNVQPSEVKKQLQAHKDIKALFLLNPTYYGFVTDLENIVQICRQHDILLLVDEAHGAHFPFHPNLPSSGMAVGADMSCVSLHKTGGALTQASALLVRNERINVKKVQQVVNMLQSTSCSYLLMSSLDGARQNLVLNGYEQITNAIYLSEYARHELNQIPGIYTIEPQSKFTNHHFDLTKVGINVRGLGLTGFDVYEIMWQRFKIQLEMPDFSNVLAIISLGDQQSHLKRLIQAFKAISNHYQKKKFNVKPFKPFAHPQVVLSPREAFFKEKELIAIEEAQGRLAGESILAYPPGIPILAPGERVTVEVMLTLKHLKQSQAFLTDNYDQQLKQILVIQE